MAATTGLSDSSSLPNVCWPCREFDRGDRVCAAGRHALHVGARGERAVAGSGEQDRPHIVVGVEAVDGVGKLVE